MMTLSQISSMVEERGDASYCKDNKAPEITQRLGKIYLQSATPVVKEEYSISLTKDGMRPIGEGRFGTVYSKKDSREVIKVFNLEAVRTLYDQGFYDPYLRYLNEASRYPNNPLFPKVTSIKVYIPPTTAGKPYAVVRMERLNKFTTRVPAVAKQTYEAILKSMGVGCGNEAVSATCKAIALGTKTKDLVQAVDVLQAVHDADLPYFGDLHKSNVMMRGTQLVVTDPFMYE